MNEEKYYALLSLFYKLREAGLLLGIDRYNDLISCLKRGYGLEDKGALYGLCQRLWIDTSNEKEKQIFQECFEQEMTLSSDDGVFSEDVQKNPSSLPSSETVVISHDKPLKPSSKPVLIQEISLVEGEKGIPSRETDGRDEIFVMERYEISPTELPLSRWDYQKIFSNLCFTGGKQFSTELDVKATIAQIHRQGIFVEPALKSPPINRKLLILIDRDGSTVPFHPYFDEIEPAVNKPSSRIQIYYFHNCPINYLYKDKFLLEGKLINKVVENIDRNRTAVLIFSDAGAARGGNNEERVRQTMKFLNQLRIPYAWLNPMPEKDWKNTTAGQIQNRGVPMFEHTRPGSIAAVNKLRRPAKHFKSWT